MKKIAKSDTIIFHSAIFYGTFRNSNSLICQKDTLWKEDVLVLNMTAGNPGRKTWQPRGPGKIYRKWETLDSIGES